MGRAPKRTFKDRTNPINLITVQGSASTVEKKEDVPALLKKLNAPEVKDRVWATVSANNLLMSEDPEIRRMLLANNIISALIERLSDSASEVVFQASSALRNLSSVDGRAADEIARMNIFAAIHALIPKLAQSIDGIVKQTEGDNKLSTSEQSMVFATADNLIMILWAICETVEWSLDQINKMGITPFLVSFFNVIDKLPPSLVQTAGQFLYTLTDDNRHAHHALINQPNAIPTLFKTVRAAGLDGVSSEDIAITRILAGAILSNIKPTALEQSERNGARAKDAMNDDDNDWETLSALLLRIVSEYITFEVHNVAKNAGSSVKCVEEARKASVMAGVPNLNTTKEEAELNKMESRISYIQIALELAANIFTDEGADEEDDGADNTKDRDAVENTNGNDGNDDNVDNEMASDDGDEDGSYGDEDGAKGNGQESDFDEEDMADIIGGESVPAKTTDEAVESSILGIFISEIIPPLMRLAEPTSMSTISSALELCSVDGIATSHKLAVGVVKSFVALQERALACFSNFLLVVEETAKPWFLAHPNEVNSWWLHLISIAEHTIRSSQVAEQLSETDTKLKCLVLEGLLSCLWTLARGMSGNVPVTIDQIKGIIYVCDTAPESSLRVKSVGILGNLARRQPGFVEENRCIGNYLLESVIAKPLLSSPGIPPHSSPEVPGFAEPIVEALDLIYDIYSDMNFDYDLPVFVTGNFLSKLQEIFNPVRKLTRAIDRRKHRALRSRADLAAANLRAFIQYKTSERK